MGISFEPAPGFIGQDGHDVKPQPTIKPKPSGKPTGGKGK